MYSVSWLLLWLTGIDNTIRPCGRLIHSSKDRGVDWALVEVGHVDAHNFNTIIVEDGLVTKTLSVKGSERLDSRHLVSEFNLHQNC
jgi:hypothetical protein